MNKTKMEIQLNSFLPTKFPFNLNGKTSRNFVDNPFKTFQWLFKFVKHLIIIFTPEKSFHLSILVYSSRGCNFDLILLKFQEYFVTSGLKQSISIGFPLETDKYNPEVTICLTSLIVTEYFQNKITGEITGKIKLYQTLILNNCKKIHSDE